MALRITRPSQTVTIQSAPMRTTRHLGLDPSLTATGWAVLDGYGVTVDQGVFKAEKAVKGGLKGWERLYWQGDQLAALLTKYEPQSVAIEGYAMNQAQGLVGLVEIGTMLRTCLIELGYPYFEVSPTQVKKFAAGSGNAKKEQVMMAVLKTWGFEAPDNNVADAYVLAQIARLLSWPDSIAKTRQEILNAVAPTVQATEAIAIKFAS